MQQGGLTTLDGDSEAEERRFARDFATFVLTNPDMRAAIQAQGAEPVAMSTANFASQLKAEYVSWKSIVEASGAQID